MTIVLHGVGVDTREDLRTYTEVDPNSRIAVTQYKADMTLVSRDEAASVYIDMGVGAIDDFEHRGEFVVNAQTDRGEVCCWAISNVADDAQAWTDNADEAVHLSYTFAAGYLFVTFRNNENGDEETLSGINLGVRWWWTIDRLSDTILRLRLFSESSRTTLIDTMTVSVASGRTHRLLYAANSFDSGEAAKTISMISENLEVVA